MQVDRPTRLLLLTLVVGGIASIFDTTIVTIGMDTLVRELDSSFAVMQWVSTGYLLAVAVAVTLVGYGQARFGGKRLWIFALALFLAGSVACAFSWSAGSLIAFRVVQGVGGGMMFPLMQTLSMQAVSNQNRARVMASISVPMALGPILGPVLGGFTLAFLDWHWLFLINVPVCGVGLVMAWRYLRPDAPSGDTVAKLDVIGLVLLGPGLALLLVGLSNSHLDGGFGRRDVFLPIVVGVVLIAAFVAWSLRRKAKALVDVSVLAVRSVRVSTITLTLLGAALFGSMFLLPLYWQNVRGYSVLAAAMLLVPQGVGSLLARTAVARLDELLGPRRLATIGFLVVALTTVPFAFADANTSVWWLGAVLFVRGLSLGIVFVPVMSVAYDDIGPDRMANASMVTRTAQQIGGSVGTAVIAIVLQAGLGRDTPAHAFDQAFWAAIAIAVLAALAALSLPKQAAAAPPTRTSVTHG